MKLPEISLAKSMLFYAFLISALIIAGLFGYKLHIGSGGVVFEPPVASDRTVVSQR